MESSDSGSLRSLRELNRSRVVGALRDRGKASRAEIARATGLSRSTVSSIVSDLIETGCSPSMGRRPAWRMGRPGKAAGASLAESLGGPCRRGRLRSHPSQGRVVSDLSHDILAEARRAGRRPLGRRGARCSDRADRQRSRGGRRRSREGARRRHGPARPDRPVNGDGRLFDPSPAGSASTRPRRWSAASAFPSTSRTTPTLGR